MRVLVDTHLFIAYLLKPHQEHFTALLLNAAATGQITLLMPETLLQEIGQTVRRKPNLIQVISETQLDRFLLLLQAVCEEIPRITETLPAVTRHPKDDYLLAYALVGEADYLLSGDKDLLELPLIPQVKIVSSGEFRQILPSH